MNKLRCLPYYLVLAFVAYMPLHIFVAQSVSLWTGGLETWKVAKDFVLLGGLALSILLVIGTGAYKKDNRYKWLLGLSVAYGLVHLLVWWWNPSIDPGNALLATAYNCRLPGFALLAWSATLVYPRELQIKPLLRLTIAMSSLVCSLGIIQYVLPKDLLTHLGYSLERGVQPAFFIDNKPDLPRVMSTLRDPNSLGAYLILPITLLTLAWLRRSASKLLIGGLLLLHGWVLFLTFSRSAWLGAVVSVSLVLGWYHKRRLMQVVRRRGPLIALLLVGITVGIFLLRDQYVIQNVVFHADENTRQTDSNNLHVDFARQGIEGIIKRPVGHGPGTAGLVSIRTKTAVMLTEDYYIQIGYEVGIVGLILLVLIMALMVRWLIQVRGSAALVLLASFAGISLCSLLLLTWSNEAVAAQWWLLAGAILGLSAQNKHRSGSKLRPKSA